MIIVDYPPGGLGNFAAQVITGTVRDPGHAVFHKNFHWGYYDIQLVQPTQADFLHQLAQWQPQHSVAICHSHGAAAELRRYRDARIISIRPVNRWLQLWLNRELKAVPSNTVQTTHSLKWHYHAIRCMKIQESYPIDHELLNFDNFYSGSEGFRHNIQQLSPQADCDGLYDLFNRTQRPILDRMAQLRQMAESGQDHPGMSHMEQAIVAWLRQDPDLATVD